MLLVDRRVRIPTYFMVCICHLVAVSKIDLDSLDHSSIHRIVRYLPLLNWIKFDHQHKVPFENVNFEADVLSIDTLNEFSYYYE